MPAESLVEVLKNIPQLTHPCVEPGVGALDDAAVVHPFMEGGEARSLVLTIDVITPIVDDARVFGRIAATNALSDVYAMGGRPEVALSFAGFPTDKLPLSMLHEVLAGMAEACQAAGCAVVGGHTIADAEPKAGLAVVGSVRRSGVWSQRGGRAGQALVLSKALGTGIVGQGIRAGKASEAQVEAAVRQMVMLNDKACSVGQRVGASACTDVTGFGLLGHLRNLVEASELDAEVFASEVPLLEGTLALVEAGVVPGGSRRNLAYAGKVAVFAEGISEARRILLCDAQTSGGLLLCVPEERAEQTRQSLVEAGCDRAAVIGRLRAREGETSRIRVVE